MKQRGDLSVPLRRVVVASLCPASPREPENVGLCPQPGLLGWAWGAMARVLCSDRLWGATRESGGHEAGARGASLCCFPPRGP